MAEVTIRHFDPVVSDDAVHELHRRVVSTSPVGHTLNRAVPLSVELV